MLNTIFTPKSIAIIGASPKGGIGTDILNNLLTQGFVSNGGTVYPIHPQADQILEQKAYPSVLKIKGNIDLAIIVVPAKIVVNVMQEIAQKGIKGVIVISAGFKEVGGDGAIWEEQIKEICIANGISLIGPNCLGVITPKIGMNASFAQGIPPVGNIAFLSQSGAICTAVIDYANARGLGFSKFVSVGNKALCSEIEMIQYLEHDEDTVVIGIYAENLVDAPAFIETMKSITKPVIILKSGRTEAGADASGSHTGALASADVLYDTLFRQANIIRASNINKLFNLMQVLSCNPRVNVKNVAIITNAGGPGVLTTDEAINSGLELAKISAQTEAKLREVLPAHANFNNPFDLIGDAKSDRYKNALEIILNDESVDSAIVILTPQTSTEIDETARAIVDVKNRINKPIVASFIGGDKVLSGVDILVKGGVANVDFPDYGVKALSKITAPKLAQNKVAKLENDEPKSLAYHQVKGIFEYFQAKNQTYLPESEAKKVMEIYDIPTVKAQFCHTSDEAIRKVADQFGGKIAMKIISPDIMHKSDVGGVMLNVEPKEVGKKFDEMMMIVTKNAPTARLEGILFAEMIDTKKGFEFILGAKKDPALGTAIMFGLGGIYVEIFADVVFGFGALGDAEVDQMIDQLKSKHILEGARGQAGLDINAVKDCIKSLSKLITDFPNITEIDMNPILVMPKGQGVKVLDAKIVVE
jgi:acetate---CoA ligase (ADP-forming)